MRRSEVLHFYGETDGTSTTGTFSLTGPHMSGSVMQIRLDKGLKARIWVRHVAGAAVKVYIKHTPDATAATPTWTTISAVDLPSEGTINLDPRKAVEVDFATGKEAIRVDWEQATAAKSHVEITIEVVESQ